ncbi:protein CHUP1, chloroplastic-like [Cornus florida]|uniref:protein CHUP1, chloroplastic-like n=1 Tax=Cornus florida TaxID=4283 RepID=UPI00289B6053|nr:protein CHUP1, chloroplastic-like [Cornus florida]
MVAGKVKQAMGLQKSPSNHKPDASPKLTCPSPSSGAKVNQKGAMFSRSFTNYFPRSSAQVQPRPPDVTELLRLVEELRERESRLKTQLLEQKLLKESVAILPRLEHEISLKDAEIDRSEKKIDCLEAENDRLRQELEFLHSKISELKDLNEKKLKVMEAEIADLKKALTEQNRVESRGHWNNEITDSDELSSSQRFFQGLIDGSVKSNLMKNVRKGAKFTDIGASPESSSKNVVVETERPRHSRCDSEEIAEISESSISVRSRVPRVPKPPPRPSSSSSSLSSSSSSSHGTLSISAERALNESSPVPPPPPVKSVPPPPPPRPPMAAPPPPPPLPAKGMKSVPTKVRRVPEVVEFYHSLMRRDSRRDSAGGTSDSQATTANARDMIGEIENRSAHLLAIKTDVETQGDFIRFLIKEVENAAFTDIEDVVPFVKWLDDELSYLVDERAVLKHFEWPEKKADALREAAFGYCDLKKLESEASPFRDNARQPCGSALKKMQALFEKIEHGVYNLSRMRESATKRYKVFQIPTDWMLDTGFVSQIKLASVKLALKYMKRVSAELETIDGGPEEEELIVQGVRFAFRVHQFAGGFDVETMRAFQELRDKARSCHIQCQNQNQQKIVCRSTAC